MKLSVIIPCKNAADTIHGQLEALAGQRWAGEWELIVSDNGSTDGTLSVVDRYRDRIPNLQVVDASRVRGGAHARNAGARVASGDALVFCDADDEVAPGWLQAIGTALSRHDFVASCLEFERLNEPWVRESRGGRKRNEDSPSRSVDRTRSSSSWRLVDLPRLSYPPHLPHAASGLGVKRRIHEAIGGFDESLPRAMDTDYCLRLQLAGFSLHVIPDAVIHMRFRTEYGEMFRQARLWAVYNTLLYCRYRPPGVRISEPWKRYLKGWKRWLRYLKRVRHRGGRARLMFLAGRQVGLLQGSLRYRTHPIFLR